MGKTKSFEVGKVYKDKSSESAYLYLGNISYKKSGKRVSGNTFVKLGKVSSSFDEYALSAVSNIRRGNVKTNNQSIRIKPTILIGEVTEKCLSKVLSIVK